jgi:hypothetical protein
VLLIALAALLHASGVENDSVVIATPLVAPGAVDPPIMTRYCLVAAIADETATNVSVMANMIDFMGGLFVAASPLCGNLFLR